MTTGPSCKVTGRRVEIIGKSVFTSDSDWGLGLGGGGGGLGVRGNPTRGELAHKHRAELRSNGTAGGNDRKVSVDVQ